MVLGPGSLFTSVLAVAAVPALRKALAGTSAPKVYVCNLRQQVPETEGYDVAAHVDALVAHGVEVDAVVCDPTEMPTGEVSATCVERELAREDGSGHDPAKLAEALSALVR